MSEPGFLDAVVVLIGHGSSKNDQSSKAVRQQAAELRRRKIFAEVQEAFWKEEPKLLEVAPSITARHIFFVPMFVSEGYFSDRVIPKALGFHDSKVQSPKSKVEGQEWFYCRPVGTHDQMAEVLLNRAREVVKEFPFPRIPLESETTLFLAGHGTEQDENSRKSIEHQALQIHAMKLYAAVEALFLEEEPRISGCYEIAKTKNLVIVPFFIGGGMHVQEDIPILLGEPERIVKKRLQEGKLPWRNPTERKGKLVWYAESVGSDPALADVIIERVKEAATHRSKK